MEQIPSILPVLPMRNSVLYPSISMPLVVGRGRSVRAIEQAEASGGLMIAVAQQGLTPEEPVPNDLYSVGTLCKIESVTLTETGNRQVVVTGIARYRVLDYELSPAGYLAGRGEVAADIPCLDQVRADALFFNLKEISREILELLPGATEPLIHLIDRVDDPAYLTHVCAAYLNLPLAQKQELLENVQLERRMESLLTLMRKEREVLSLQHEIREKMAERLNKAQREALLREQMRTIQTELGEESAEESPDDIIDRLREAGLPPEAERVAQEELRRLRSLPPSAAEYHVIRTYLELLASLPWARPQSLVIDLARARKVLDHDHYGLEAVKKRILQYLAVAKLKNDLHGPILCLVGPPGVGKTSLGHSIADALGRKFVRTSLGGVRDEAEIRGHRRTYVGAMPGRIIQGLRRIGTRNPVMLLDEIDKLRADFHGDPSSAMLEVLDPEQNRAFTDHYLDVPFDLSEVFFICTANVVDTIPPALRDRMEMIEVNGYTSHEKLRIARRHLIPKQLREHGLEPDWIDLPDAVLDRLITRYTREAGVRELQRAIAGLFRAAAEDIVGLRENGAHAPLRSLFSLERLPGILGPERFVPEIADRTMRAGVATGLAWTPHGGDLLFMEAKSLPHGKGNLILTGQLGDVMKESAQIALSLARALLPGLYARRFDFNSQDLHVHVPAGAIPKDGPSAGITLLAALASLMLGQPVAPGLAMSGEITLRGAILPVGGIKEKVLAAQRAGLDKLILPRRNEQDLLDVPEEVRSQLHIIFVDTVEEALRHALEFDHGAQPALRVS